MKIETAGFGRSILAFSLAMFWAIRCLCGSSFSVVDDDRGDPRLPVERHAAEVGLVADLEVEVVEPVQLRDGLADERLLLLLEVLMLEGVGLGPGNRATPLTLFRAFIGLISQRFSS